MSVLASAVALGVSEPAEAQSIRESVRRHVSEGLEDQSQRPPPKAKKKRARPASGPKATSPAPAAAPTADAAPEASTPGRPPADAPSRPTHEPVAPDPAAATDALPQRVLGKNLELDAKVGGGIRGWYPEQY